MSLRNTFEKTGERHGVSRSQFEFVSISHPDEIKDWRVRRKIHQHTMKEIGWLRRKKGANNSHVVETQLIRKADEPDSQSVVTGSLIRSSPEVHTTLHLPANNRAQNMNNFLFRQHSAFCNKVRELCFSLAMFDDGVYCLALAEMAIHGETPTQYSLPHQENDVSLKYYSQSVAHINQHIQSSVATKTGDQRILGAVLGLASYDVSVGNMQRWEMHMAGLKTLIHSCTRFHPYKSIFFMLSLLWTETTGCLVLDRKPYVIIPLEIMQPYHEPVERPILAQSLKTLRSLDPQLDEVAGVLELLTGLTKSFEMKQEGEDHESTVYCITRARVSYLMLSMPRASSVAMENHAAPSTRIILSEAIRLAVLIFLLRMAGFVPGGAVSRHAVRLATWLESYDQRWDKLPELELWVLTIAAVASDNTQHRILMTCRIGMIIKELGIPWAKLGLMLQQIAWVESLFDYGLREVKAIAAIYFH